MTKAAMFLRIRGVLSLHSLLPIIRFWYVLVLECLLTGIRTNLAAVSVAVIAGAVIAVAVIAKPCNAHALTSSIFDLRCLLL